MANLLSTSVTGTITTSSHGTSANWNTAYGWGNHASAGYLTSYTETDTLASVTGRGATTTSPITINGGGTQPLSLTTNSGSPWHLSLNRTDLGLTSRVFAHNSPYNGWYFEHNISIAGNTNWHSGNLTNNNQLTNGAGYITGISSGNVTTALGYTPWNYGGVDAGRNIGASTNLDTDLESGGVYGSYGAGGTSWNAPFSYGAVLAFAFTSGIKAQFGFDIRHNQSDYGDLRYRTKNNLGYSTWRTMWHSGNLTNLNQLTNGPGYITGYTETDTLQSVTSRGASTNTHLYINNNNPTLYLQDTDHRSAMIHVNSDYFYILNGAGTNSTGWVQPANSRYLFTGNLNNNNITFGGSGDFAGTVTASGGNSSNWNTAYGWGNHASAGYITSAGSISGNANTTSQKVFNDLKIDFPSGGSGGYSFGSNHYSMGLDVGNGAWSHPHYKDVIIGYHTGVRIGAHYSGIRFYNNSPTTDANNDGNGDGGESLLMTIGGYVGTANHTDVVVNNNLIANVSLRAPIFYDSADTTYYLDPNSTSNLAASYIGRVLINYDGTDTWFRMQSGNRMRITTTGGTDFIIPNTGEMSYNGNTVIHTGNIGSQSVATATTATTANSLAANTSPTIRVLNFSGVGGNSGNANQSYAIYQEGGEWSPPFPDLCIGYHTGIKLGAHSSYNGIRFYNNSDMVTETFSVGNGDNHVRVAYNLYVGGTISGSNLSGTNTGDQTNISGNAGTVGGFSAGRFFRDLGFEGGGSDANTIAETRSAFTYASGAPHSGPLAYFGASGYGLQLNATYHTGDQNISYRVRNGDAGAFKAWYQFITSANIGGQSVSYAATAGSATSAGSAPNASNANAYYNVTPGNGYGLKFWSSDAYKISMGASALYYYGPVTDYSIKTQMNNTDPGRGFTWGRESYAPIAGLNATSGNMQIAGTFTSTAHYITGSTNGGYIYSDDWGIKMANNNGYIQFGPANGSWAHIYSGLPFYFNQELYVNGQQVLNTSNYSSYALPLSGGTVTGITYFHTNNGAKSGATDSAKLQAYSTGNNAAFMSFHKSANYAVNFGLDDDNVMRLGGWSASANRWQLDMSGNMTVAGDVTAYSDARVKTNIHTIENALEKTLALRGVSYNRTDSDDVRTKIGVIAQETLPIVPEVVNQDNAGMYNVSYGNMTALLIEAIKEQQVQIEEMKKEIKELKNK